MALDVRGEIIEVSRTPRLLLEETFVPELQVDLEIANPRSILVKGGF